MEYLATANRYYLGANFGEQGGIIDFRQVVGSAVSIPASEVTDTFDILPGVTILNDAQDGTVKSDGTTGILVNWRYDGAAFYTWEQVIEYGFSFKR